MNTSFFNELLTAVAERGRALIEPRRERRDGTRTLPALVAALLSERGEASGAAIAADILATYRGLDAEGRAAAFRLMRDELGADPDALRAAANAYLEEPTEGAVGALYDAATPRRLELLRRLNLAPEGTRALVDMRADLLAELASDRSLSGVDRDFERLFDVWFNRGFLVLRRIDWSSPASVLSQIIAYEAVHEIHDWDDLRRRIDPPDRRCYAFFHPALVDEPLIFVEVALTRSIPEAIGPILAAERETVPPGEATTAVFYSISNCQVGLRGVSFGSFLLKQVVEELARDLPGLKSFVTLSPVPGFAAWLAGVAADADHPLAEPAARAVAALGEPDWQLGPNAAALGKTVLPLAAHYFLRERSAGGRPLDPVARFHLGNGARLERLDWLADPSPKGLEQSHGLMVNYLYERSEIEANHEAYARTGKVAAAPGVSRLLRSLPSPQPAA
ncbi:malonyl-CoA decarboxylase family protein [Pseudoxanthobacter sp. M-2]|uniref:malonyl-CoA decarboxylase domain-containing protein n=1 Tax=Pseudoxanthobacter sp. M-2 TaxID=3078754 RepID=UPI0038FD2901